MSDFNRCSKLRILPNVMDKAEPIPEDYAEHLKVCALCGFWTSFSLAIQEVFHDTDRIRHKDCPPGEDFHQLLAGAAQILRNLNPGLHSSDHTLTAKASVAFLSQSLIRQNPRLIETKVHMEKCATCDAYFTMLYNKMLEAQKIYERKILRDEPLVPKIKKTAIERII